MHKPIAAFHETQYLALEIGLRRATNDSGNLGIQRSQPVGLTPDHEHDLDPRQLRLVVQVPINKSNDRRRSLADFPQPGRPWPERSGKAFGNRPFATTFSINWPHAQVFIGQQQHRCGLFRSQQNLTTRNPSLQIGARVPAAADGLAKQPSKAHGFRQPAGQSRLPPKGLAQVIRQARKQARLQSRTGGFRQPDMHDQLKRGRRHINRPAVSADAPPAARTEGYCDLSRPVTNSPYGSKNGPGRLRFDRASRPQQDGHDLPPDPGISIPAVRPLLSISETSTALDGDRHAAPLLASGLAR